MQNKEIEEDGFSIDLTEEQAEDFKKAFRLDKLEEIHKRFENGTETIDDIKKHCLNYIIKTENGVELKLVETKYFEKLIKYIDQLEIKVKELKTENENLIRIQEEGLNRESQHCFHEDGNTGKCLGYGDDEPCEYCKTCERLSIKENN